ncbi:MAG TPA: coenzyme F420-0:L-glutamate ligase, partial [Candidatus Binatia bacterium]|nr:coenzyme F420-0:L-glutamate ligase [Candidatus Binatia bacterium]
MKRIELVGLEGIAEVHAGDSVGQLICDACERQQFVLADGDVLVVAQKIVSKAEGRMVELATVRPSARAHELARELGKEPELIEVILGESRRVVRTGGRAMIVETHHGFVCANAGVDQSNV